MKEKIIVKNLYKVFGNNPKKALKLLDSGLHKDEIFKKTGMTVGVQDSNFSVNEGEIFVVMGLSGSGKSTLIRLLNRLIEPSSGQIFLDDTDITNLNDKELQEIRRKKISMVFQSFALMPHMNIIDNVSFGLELSGIDKDTRYKKAQIALEQVGLDEHSHSYPDELSGGMQQRVGLARALANDPDILLMDEAFSALDPLIRTEMQDELLKLQSEMKKTIVFISHDLDEAIRIGDRIAIMREGETMQIGTPEEIINNPANDYIRSFFKGVDVTSVLTASHIAKKIKPTIVDKDSTGVKSALQYISDFNEDYAYFIGKDGKYLGILTLETLKQQEKLGGSVYDAIYCNQTINEHRQIADFIIEVAEYQYPIPVVDDNGKYKGTISKSRLLKVFDEGVENV